MISCLKDFDIHETKWLGNEEEIWAQSLEMAGEFRLRAGPWTRWHTVLCWEVLMALGHSWFDLPAAGPGWWGTRPGPEGCEGTVGGCVWV